jgi:hypothetical protein
MGVPKATVQRLWSANAIRPHLVRTLQAVERPGVRGQVLGRDRPLSRSTLQGAGAVLPREEPVPGAGAHQPGLPLGVGHIRTKTHDYTPHGTITLFAALSYLDGKIFGQIAPRHTHHQWLAFLKHLDAKTPVDLTLHLVIDNYATHKHPKVKSCIAYRNRRQRKPMAASASSFISPRPPARG